MNARRRSVSAGVVALDKQVDEHLNERDEQEVAVHAATLVEAVLPWREPSSQTGRARRVPAIEKRPRRKRLRD
jgi:hypothetical protein